jgi:translation elongation factor EF-G
MILVINKLDRLITDQQIDTQTAYYQIQKLLVEVNAVVSQFIISDLAAKMKLKRKSSKNLTRKKSINIELKFSEDL